jgi:hypothetical protein
MDYHYFADYEIYNGGSPVLWGHITLTWHVDAPGRLQPAEVLQAIRRQAADRHGLEPADVRLRTLARM